MTDDTPLSAADVREFTRVAKALLEVFSPEVKGVPVKPRQPKKQSAQAEMMQKILGSHVKLKAAAVKQALKEN